MYKFTNTLLVISILLMISVLFSSCRNRRRLPYSRVNNPPTQVVYETKNITIINNNNTYDQRQTNNLTVQNIKTTNQQELNQTINEIAIHTVNAAINNTSVNLAVDNSIHTNYISQPIAQILTNREGDNYNINEGNTILLNNIRISNILVSGIIAEVNNAYNEITLCNETYNQLRQMANNINFVNDGRNVGGRGQRSQSSNTSNGNSNGNQYNSTYSGGNGGNGIYQQPRQPQYKGNNVPGAFRGTDPGGWNFLTIIGAIVVVLFVLWIISWFVRS